MSEIILPDVDDEPYDGYSRLRTLLNAYDKASGGLRVSASLSTEQPNEHNAARLIAKAKMLAKAREAAIETKVALDAEIARLSVVSDAPKNVILITSSGLQEFPRKTKRRKAIRRAA